MQAASETSICFIAVPQDAGSDTGGFPQTLTLMRRHFVTGLFLALIPSAPIGAQSSSEMVAGLTDSTVMSLILPGFIGDLSGVIARPLYDSTQWPWSFSMPDSASQSWQKISAYLFSLVNARKVTAADTIVSYLNVWDISFRNDSLVVQFTSGTRWYCPENRWTGGSTSYKTVVTRHGKNWTAPRTEPTEYGDGMCKIQRPVRADSAR